MVEKYVHAIHQECWGKGTARLCAYRERPFSEFILSGRHFVHTTDSQHPYPVYPNLVKGMTIAAPDVVWVADLTYIRLPSTFVYLAAILDAYSRKCVGWKLSKRINTQLALGALEAALATCYIKAGLIHHSDRGVSQPVTSMSHACIVLRRM